MTAGRFDGTSVGWKARSLLRRGLVVEGTKLIAVTME
jgi:hypothetical protein